MSVSSLHPSCIMVYSSIFKRIIMEFIIINDVDSFIMGVQTLSTGTDPTAPR